MGGIAAIVATVLSTAVSVASEVQSSKFQSKVAANNAAIDEINADIARKDGLVEQANAAEEAHRALGRQRAAQAEGGILGSATGDLALEQAEAEARENQLNIGYQAERNAQGYMVSAQNKRNQASAANYRAGVSGVSGVLGASKSLLGSIGGYRK